MELHWTRSAAHHIASRSERYAGATDIKEEWASEVVNDPRALVADPDSRSGLGALRIVGYSPAAGFVITVIRLSGELWGVTAWKTTGVERRGYLEARNDKTN